MLKAFLIIIIIIDVENPFFLFIFFIVLNFISGFYDE